MQDFKDLRAQLKQARQDKTNAGKALFLKEEKLKKLDQEKEKRTRVAATESVLQDIEAAQNVLRQAIRDDKSNLTHISDLEANVFNSFNFFTDPRAHLGKLPDTHPILLSPVRIETRFKKQTEDGRVRHQLWVRVFPDECSIDTFEDVPTASELTRVEAYWASVWAAGQSNEAALQSLIQNRKKAAWQSLVGQYQAGRAYWLIQNYTPENRDELPQRTQDSQLILTILTQEKPVHKAALESYWKSYWAAQGEVALLTTAFQTLSATVGGDDTAHALITKHTPFNIDSVALAEVKVWFVKPEEEATVRPAGTNEVILKILLGVLPIPVHKAALERYWIAFWKANGDAAKQTEALNILAQNVGDLAIANALITEYTPSNMALHPFPEVTVSFLKLPNAAATDTKQSAWSQAAKIHSFPERFVLLGYKEKDSRGNPIEVHEILKAEFVATILALATVQEQETALTAAYDSFSEAFKATQTLDVFLSTYQSLNAADQPEALADIFDNLRDDVKAGKYVDYLCERSETKWLFDFERAVEVGMAFKVTLTQEVYDKGFDRLFVLGVKLGADHTEGQDILENLLAHHHYGTSGFSIVPQGTPTNNTEEEDSGFTEEDDADETFYKYFLSEKEADPDDDKLKKDGKWLADLLGVDAERSSLKVAANYHHTDQREARAMHRALFDTTLGYFMESMITPIVDEDDIEFVKTFFTNYVSGRGNVPAIRIGEQPYGILPIQRVVPKSWVYQRENNVLSNSKYANLVTHIQKLYSLVLDVREDFDDLSNDVAYVGKTDEDVHKMLLQTLGLHATSVNFDQRIAQSFSHLYNRAKLSGGLAKFIAKLVEGLYKKQGLDLLAELGYVPDEGEEGIPILEKFFFTKENRITKVLVDDQPLSETKPIRGYTEPENEGDSSENYIHWLIDKAKTDFEAIKRQKGFTDNKIPNTLLYQMLRQAVLLGYSDTGFKLYQVANLLNTSQIKAAKIDQDFIGVKVQPDGFESKWEYLDVKVNQITNENITVSEHITKMVIANSNLAQTARLRATLEALEHLKDVPTARLERLFAEHLDCCSYRLDAWLMGFVRLQLELMRKPQIPGTTEITQYQPGIYLGAYGWVEHLTPDDVVLTPVRLPDDLESIFNPDGDLELLRDSTNGGYIHAPSINQAMTASILRNAYLSNAAAEHPETYKVNLSSERVRMALSILEGLQQGQNLSALLGYQLERGLHDRTDEALDVFIYELRKVFPLVANRNRQTNVKNDDRLKKNKAITKMEARNVIDGLALINHVKETKNASYPFGFPTGEELNELKVATANERAAITTEVNRILNINDALADLAIAEGIHQVVQSNYDRAAGALDTYSKGSFPQMPDVVRTPRSGVSLTHRVGIHLQSGIVPAADSNPRVLAEPAINDFLNHTFPELSQIVCKVVLVTPAYEEGESPTEENRFVSMADLGLAPIDLLYMIDVDKSKSLTVLDEHILKHIRDVIPNLRPDTTLQIKYTEAVVDKISILEISPLIKNLQELCVSGRPLQPTDIQLPNEATATNDSSQTIVKTRVTTVLDRLLELFVDATDVSKGMKLQAHVLTTHFDEEFRFTEGISLEALVVQLDGYWELFTTQLAELSTFGIEQSGFGFTYDRKGSIYADLYRKVVAYKNRWVKKLETFDARIVDAADPALSDEDKSRILKKAERAIATSYTSVLPVIPDPLDPIGNFEALLIKKRALFATKLQQINDEWLAKDFVTFKALLDSLKLLKEGKITDPDTALEVEGDLELFDAVALDTQAEEHQIVVLAEDMIQQIAKLNTFMMQQVEKVQELLSAHDATAAASKKVELLTEAIQQLLGADFKIVPEFELSVAQQIEIQNSHNDKAQLLAFQLLKAHVDFPVDDWLYGVSRVREKMHAWEQVVTLSDAMNGTELELQPLQLPYSENDTWLALDYDPEHSIDNDKILYTSYFRAFNVAQKQCGLLVDEWTEVIPTKDETTGLSFQYDQPNAEPPQTLLLATPSRFTGEWRWDDLTGALHEALDLAQLRALEPEHLEETAYAQFLPATISAVTYNPLATLSVNYALSTNFNFETNTN